ncbi:hypothetical protein KR222_002753, partial [Zaprionus bogoriensis]
KRTWDYEFLSVTATSSDDTKLNVNLRIDRVARGKSAISGTVLWLFEADDTLIVKLVILSSQSGREDDYNPTPYKVQPVSFNEYMDNYYQDLGYKNFENCSNLPDLKDGFVLPWPQGTYNFNLCAPDVSGFPDILPVGYYKLLFSLTGPVDVHITLIVKLTARMF